MNKKLIILSIAIIAVVIILIVVITRESLLSPQSLEECKILSYFSPQSKNLVFFSTKQQAQDYSDYLIQQEPFQSNKQALNLFYIDTYSPECELYKEKAVLCYSKDLVKKASSCPNDFIVVIADEPSNIRSSAYMNTMSLNKKHSKNVFLHELGHVLAFLADEYIPATLPRKSKNCVQNCNKFSVSDGCFQGCSKSDYYRSIESGVMRTLSTSAYGKFNNKLILNELVSVSQFTGSVIQSTSDCQDEKYYLVEGSYKQNNIEIIDKGIEQGCIGLNGKGDFEYKLVMQDNSISQQNFNPELIFTDAEGEEQINGEVLQSDKNFYLKVPIIENAKSLEISKDQQTLTQINLIGFDARPCKK